MKILLDTHIAIWAVLDSEELSDAARGNSLRKDAKRVVIRDKENCGEICESVGRIGEWTEMETNGSC